MQFPSNPFIQMTSGPNLDSLSPRERVICAHAVWTRRQALFVLPQHVDALLASKLYLAPGGRISLHTDAEGEAIDAIQDALNELSPVSLFMTIKDTVPEGVFIPSDRSPVDEAWCVDEPMPLGQLNQLLSLVDATLTDGNLDWREDLGFCFISPGLLSREQVEQVRDAARAIGIVVDAFVLDNSPAAVPVGTLVTRRQAKQFPASLRASLEQDEATWHRYVEGRCANQPEPLLAIPASACLIDGGAQGDVTLSELLCLYDVVNVVVPRQQNDWLTSNRLVDGDVAELCGTGRVRLVLPHGLQEYPISLLADVAEQLPGALVLSRELAVRTMESNMRKDPLTYGRLPSEFKAALRGALYQLLPEVAPMLAGPIKRSPMASLDFALATSGAMGLLAVGPGARLADQLESRGTPGPSLELMLASAGVEWALGLGAAWVPRVLADYDETAAARAVGSFWSRSSLVGGDLMADRMHTVVDGLLAVADVPPIEVARSLSQADRSRFATVAKKLFSADVPHEELREAVDALNRQTKNFERKIERLRRWDLYALAGGVAAKPLADAIDAGTGVYYASVAAGWLYNLLKRRLPRYLNNEFETLAATMVGLCTAPSIDPVIVSRARAQLSSTRPSSVNPR